ncbi:AAA family ATPase [Adhaeribacter radiodurans]|uniref:AAA family ATPase n=1 Tax=Adhaeribacter radiodurans TaxID=2745197 RepID=A0A7L7L7H3_9BACT|nr:AAA family ATPase [Adhaeribacter radiodurans]QMU28776.1 AAA family ATPase [Adhaeribacter radiodurans]
MEKFSMNSSTFPITQLAQPQSRSTIEEHFADLQKLRFDATKPIKKPEAVISIVGHTISTRGNLTTLAGQAKAGKSGVLSGILVGVMARPGDTPDTLGLTISPNLEGKCVLHIDGEQSRYDHYRGLMKVLQRASRTTHPEWFHSYNLRELEIHQRRAKLKFLCEHVAKLHGGIHLIILDGGADFVLDINDQKESNEVVKFFETLAIEYECPVVIVLHFNPNSEKTRGHFGSQLERKSESVIAVAKDNDSEISTIEGKFLRNTGNLPNLQFRFDPEKGHHVYHAFKVKTTKAENKEDALRRLVDEICPDLSRVYTYSEIWKSVETATGLREASAKNRVREMVDKGHLLKDEEGGYRRIRSSSNSLKVA